MIYHYEFSLPESKLWQELIVVSLKAAKSVSDKGFCDLLINHFACHTSIHNKVLPIYKIIFRISQEQAGPGNI
jgi:hypothetical protein